MDIDPRFIILLAVFSFYTNIAVSIYGVIGKPNLVKKLIALTIFQDTINIFAIVVGYRLVNGLPPIPAVLTDLDIEAFVSRAVDPLPQALVLTAIVISLAVTLFLATATIYIHMHFKTVDVDVISRIKRGEIFEEIS